jgi:hypothetical protein
MSAAPRTGGKKMWPAGRPTRLADRICALRRGRQIGVRDSRAVTRNETVSMMRV